jgi:methyl-accepting chemotaxis protein
MNYFTSTAAKTVFYVLVIFGTAGWLAAFYATGQIETAITGYHAAVGRQVNAAFVLANANRLLLAQRDDISEMLIDPTASGSRADLDNLNIDETAFSQSLTSAAALAPAHAAEILALQSQASQVIGKDCAKTVSLGSIATTDADVIASEHIYLDQCGPKFAPLLDSITTLQNGLRNERNARVASLQADSKAASRMTYDIVIGWLVLTLLFSLATAHTWRLPLSSRMTNNKPSLAP